MNILVRSIYLTLVKKENLRRLFAAAFLIFLLAEWGSHAMINAAPSSADQQSISANEGGHDDPCQSLILCSDNKRKDQQLPNFSHEVTHNGLLDVLSNIHPRIDVLDDPLIPFTNVNGLFRPISPPFHPPELS